ncbi:MAG: lytic murein transglycosylase, partial [Pseudomonadota bacterium]
MNPETVRMRQISIARRTLHALSRAAILGALGVLACGATPVVLSAPAAAQDEEEAPRVRKDPAGFQAWVRSFRAEALAAGVPADVFDGAFAGVRLNQRVLELDGRQFEFVTPTWDYLDRLVSAKRIAAGL